MGNIRSLKRSVTRSPDRVWLAKQKVQEDEKKAKQKEAEEKEKLELNKV